MAAVLDRLRCVALFRPLCRYADFTQSGKNYVPFPDPKNFRIKLERLQDPEVREQFRQIWLNPQELAPAKISAAVTQALLAKWAELAKQLEFRKQKGEAEFTPERLANFLMRCLFRMFAEDIGLLPSYGFTESLKKIRSTPEKFAPMIKGLWETMNTGGFSNLLLENLLRFNGGLFEDCEALPLNADQLELLIEAGEANWRDVEPAIFGTLLERALDPVERHKLGSHYTPRAYVERLVIPTLIEPLREQWENAYATATLQDEDGKSVEYQQSVCFQCQGEPCCCRRFFRFLAMRELSFRVIRHPSCRWELTMKRVSSTMKAEPCSVPCRQGAAERVAARGPLVFFAY